MNVYIHIKNVAVWIYACMYVWMDVCMDGWMDGWNVCMYVM